MCLFVEMCDDVSLKERRSGASKPIQAGDYVKMEEQLRKDMGENYAFSAMRGTRLAPQHGTRGTGRHEEVCFWKCVELKKHDTPKASII